MKITQAEIQRFVSNIDQIVFDFGGVIIDLFPEKTYQKFTEILNREFDPDNIPDRLVETLLKFETGKCRLENWMWELQNFGFKKPLPRAIIDAWNEMLGDWDTEKMMFLENLRKKIPIYLLSNTNEVHINQVQQYMKDVHKVNDFESRFFNKVYYSHVVGLRKPDREIFEFLKNDLEIQANRTLFIDDTPQNVESASKSGYISLLHPRNESLDYLRIFFGN